MEILNNKGYEAISRIGSGGFAEVYVLKEIETGKLYAGKVSGRTEMLEQESLLMKGIDHPLYPKWHSYWQGKGEACLVMELIGGDSLDKLIRRREKLSQRLAVRIAMELADGLNWLHECSPPVLYRDLKPANIIIQETGRVRLIDLGAAGTQLRLRAGTEGYAAPEIFEAGHQSNSCDIYSLGKVLHYMLTGIDPCKPPYEAKPIRVYGRHLWRGLEQIVEKCLIPSPEERIPGMRELIRQLIPYHEYGDCKIFFREVGLLLKSSCKRGYRYEKNVWKA